MSEDQGPRNEFTDSNTVIERFLREDFEKTRDELSTDELVEWLESMVEALPVEDTKIVSIVGGAASGKSELARRLVKRFENQGLLADTIGTDDYNFGDRTWRRENFEGENPPSPVKKYDFSLLNEQVQEIKNLTDDETVRVPEYNEKTGWARDAEVWPHEIRKVDVLFVQGDFHPVEKPDMMIYLHLSDGQRLENRKRRDANHREKDEQAVIDIFNYRQGNQHFPHTLPQAEKADMIVVADAANAESWKYDVYDRKTAAIEKTADSL